VTVTVPEGFQVETVGVGVGDGVGEGDVVGEGDAVGEGEGVGDGDGDGDGDGEGVGVGVGVGVGAGEQAETTRKMSRDRAKNKTLNLLNTLTPFNNNAIVKKKYLMSYFIYHPLRSSLHLMTVL